MDRLVRIATSTERLAQLATEDRTHFLAADSDLPAIAESHLRRSLEAVFDVGRHILAKTGRGDLAREYKSIAAGLAQYKIVSEDLGQTLVHMAGYRNRLVHLYHPVIDEELYDLIREHLEDLRRFVREIRDYLANRPYRRQARPDCSRRKAVSGPKDEAPQTRPIRAFL